MSSSSRRNSPRFPPIDQLTRSDRNSRLSERSLLNSAFQEPNRTSLPVINPSISSMRPRPPKYPDMSLRNPDFCFGLLGSILFHLFIGFLLMYDASNPHVVLMNESQNAPGQIAPMVNSTPVQPEIIKAISVNSEEVNQEVNRLKQERIRQEQAEKTHQQQLARQAELARQQRVMEEKRFNQLKEESEKIAIVRKKQREEQERYLKQLAVQKAQEIKRQEIIKTQQEILKKQQEEARAAKEQAEKERAALAIAEAIKRQEAAAHQAQLDAANQARMAGVVDKYKALIIDAISRQWILPDNVNQNLSSQFRIRLAPDGGVLEVSLIRSSGDPILDRSAQTAIYKASPLPVPGDSATFNLFRDISLTVRPENIRG